MFTNVPLRRRRVDARLDRGDPLVRLRRLRPARSSGPTDDVDGDMLAHIHLRARTRRLRRRRGRQRRRPELPRAARGARPAPASTVVVLSFAEVAGYAQESDAASRFVDLRGRPGRLHARRCRACGSTTCPSAAPGSRPTRPMRALAARGRARPDRGERRSDLSATFSRIRRRGRHTLSVVSRHRRASRLTHRRPRHPRAARATRSTPRSSPAGWRPHGWQLVDDAADADVAVVNTCGFVEQAKKDSIDTLLEAADLDDGAPDPGRRRRRLPGRALRHRAGRAAARGRRRAGLRRLRRLSAHLDAILRGGRPTSHVPRDRRTLLPARAGRPRRRCRRHRSPVTADSSPTCPTASRRPAARGSCRRRLDGRPVGAAQDRLGLRPALHASAPSRRSAGRSSPGRPPRCWPRPRWLAEQGVREVLLVSENSTSYGKDLGDLRLLETLLPELGRRRRARRGSGSPTCSRPRCGPAWSR